MKVYKVINKSKDGNKMEVIAIDNNNTKQTLHINKVNNVWKYYEGINNGIPIYQLITI